ncbi:unnamed protein product, partial [Coregonus sp. 'balchen']
MQNMGQFNATNGKQALEIRSSLSERRDLTDPILPGDSSDMALAHNVSGPRLTVRTHLKHNQRMNVITVRFDLSCLADVINILIVDVTFLELPESIYLDFECGAQTKLDFSDVLVIYTHIVKKPEDMSFCQAHIINFSLDQLWFTACLQGSFKAVHELVDWTTD